MLTQLSIKNFALIDSLHVNFDEGLTIITGETGTGKSILLGGLALVLGKRADLSSLKNPDKKCIIEAEFAIEKYKLKSFFKVHDLEYESNTIIRREILPSGKSRAFINDSPVRLDVLNLLSGKLIDIHSQHQTLQLTENKFQFQIIDTLAGIEAKVADYKVLLQQYQEESKALVVLRNEQSDLVKEHDYNTFLLKELEEATLEGIVLSELEAQYERLNNIEDIKTSLQASQELLTDEQLGILNLLSQLYSEASNLSGIAPEYAVLAQRIKSVQIELDDVQQEIETLASNAEFDPQQFEEIGTKLQKIFDLQKKHAVLTIEELQEIEVKLSKKVAVSENIEEVILTKETQIASLSRTLQEKAKKIHQERTQSIPKLTKQLESLLADLGMENARFDIQILLGNEFLSNGMDSLQFLFSANKGGNFSELKKAASGGELSRVMLCIKAILSKYMQLPTIMFDEIDTGISGEIANKTAVIMRDMSTSMQVFTITHLPQIAAKGQQHYKVYKQETQNETTSHLKKLNEEERILEIAQMLSGAKISESALANAKELLN